MAIPGTPCPDFDAFVLKAENIARDAIQPRVAGLSFARIDGYPNGSVLVVHVPRSWTGPHMAAAPNQSHFFSRSNSGKFAMDVQQIRSAFIAGTHVAQRIQEFRTERIGRILANQGAMPLNPKEPKLIVHVHPLADAPDVFAGVTEHPESLAPDPRCSGNDRFNLDGFVSYPILGGNPASTYCYSMLFRNGAFEHCEPIHVDTTTQPDSTSGSRLEGDVFSAASKFVTLSRRHGELGPLVVMASLTGLAGVRIGSTNQRNLPWQTHYVVDRNVVALPELVIETETLAAEDLRVVFDALWQASGSSRSPSFSENGKWAQRGN